MRTSTALRDRPRGADRLVVRGRSGDLGSGPGPAAQDGGHVASQSHGTGEVGLIAPRPLLLIHGSGDRTLTYQCSVDIAKRAGGPKKLVLFPGADHGISQDREEMYGLVRDWFREYL